MSADEDLIDESVRECAECDEEFRPEWSSRPWSERARFCPPCRRARARELLHRQVEPGGGLPEGFLERQRKYALENCGAAK